MYGWHFHPMSGVWWTTIAILTLLFVTLLIVGLTSWRRATREPSTQLRDEAPRELATQRFTYGLSATRHTRARERAKHS